jgi:hypothetical protein
MIVSMGVASPMRRFGLFLRAAGLRGIGLEVFLRRSLELGSAAGAAEQYVFAIVRQPMRRIAFDNHAADWVTEFCGVVVSVLMVGVSVHGFLARISRS